MAVMPSPEDPSIPALRESSARRFHLGNAAPADRAGTARPRILLADAQVLFLEGMRHLLETRGYDVVGACTDGLSALAGARELHPDVILMDVSMPLCDGLSATRLIKAEMPEIKVVMLTTVEEDETLFEAIRSGASGYLLKRSDGQDFLNRLSGLSSGDPPLSPGLASKILKEFALRERRDGQRPATASIEKLTPRQVGVLTLVAQGKTYREVAATLVLREDTVKYHMEQILERLHLDNRAQLIAYAERVGLIPQ